MASGTDGRGVPAMLTRNSHRFRCKYTRGHVYLAVQDFRYARYTARDTHTHTPTHTDTNRGEIVERTKRDETCVHATIETQNAVRG